MIKHRLPFLFNVFLFFSLVSILPLGCKGDGEGEFNLEERQGTFQTQTLLIQTQGEVAAIEMEMPFRASDTLPDSITVELGEAAPEDTHMDYAVKAEEGKINVAILSGLEDGFDGRPLSLVMSYAMLGEKQDQNLFHDVTVNKVLDKDFHSGQITWTWTN